MTRREESQDPFQEALKYVLNKADLRFFSCRSNEETQLIQKRPLE